MEKQEFVLSAKDGLKLSGRIWEAAEPKAALCVVHGLGDHNLRHLPFIEYMVENGITIYAYDQRGHGISEGKRGHTPSYQTLLDDLYGVMEKMKEEQAHLPAFLYGHSFGGNVVANFILRYGESLLNGGIVSSAWLRLHFPPPAVRVALGKLMKRIYPSYTDTNDIDPRHLSADLNIVKGYTTDPLVHPYITATTYFETAEAAQWALQHADQLKTPTLIMHGEKDETTSPLGSDTFARKAGKLAELKIWGGMLHETHNEVGKEKVFAFVHDWITNKIGENEGNKEVNKSESGEEA